MRYYRRPTGVALGVVLLALIFVFIGLCALTATPARALTADQEQALTDYAEMITDAYAETGVLETVEFYIPSLSAYVITDVYPASISEVKLHESIGSSLSDDIHERFTGITLPAALESIAALGIEEINVIGVTYSSDGYLLYLSINGVNMSTHSDLA